MRAYGSLTIIDLLDTATYIYYADDAEGTNPSASPAGKTYIGIYSGPVIAGGQPAQPPAETEWVKYVGEDGTSVTIASTSVKYIASTNGTIKPDPTANWSTTIPEVKPGEYLWTWTQVNYSDGKTTNAYSVSYSGEDANSYYIQTNQEEVLVFITSNGKEISPAILTIKLYELPLSNESKNIDFSQNYSFGYIGSNGQYASLITEALQTCFEFTEQQANNNEKIFSYDFRKLLEINSNLIPVGSVLKFAYLQDNKEVAVKIIPYKLGTSEDMAQFNVEATKINAAVRDSFLQFDEKGLSLYVSGAEENAGLKIYKKVAEQPDEKVFWADGQGNLNIKGNIYAENGEFNGTIHATYADFEDGKIGGFKIEGTQLSSTDANSSLVLNGADGSIVANKIILGTGAEIADYIELGSAKLMNPTEENDYKILQSGGIIINDNGTAKFGNIIVDGMNSKIYGIDNSWCISQDRAEFKNISVSGSIETVVFKTATTQAVGSAMLFMQSYKIEDISGTIVTLDQNIKDQIPNGTLVWLVNNDNNYREYTVQSSTETTVTLNIPAGEVVSATAMLIIGLPEDTPLIFGVNGSNTKTASNLIYPRGLTINEYGNVGIDTSGNPKLPHLFLGDLSVLNGGMGISYQGYGLYSDNVYLNGSLTTKLGDNSYAGINTLNGATATEFGDTDSSKIVFWAGADSTSTVSIQNSPFQVTEDGSVFASRAKLVNSLTVGGEIHGTDIYTARLHGEGGALSIYDSSDGIIFKTGYGTNDKETFRICASGLTVGENSPFIEIIPINEQRSLVSVWTDSVGIKSNEQYLSLTTQNVPALYHQHSSAQSCGFYFDNGKTLYKMTSGSETKTKTVWSSSDIKLLGAISFAQGEDDTRFQYRPVDGGYDLYVTE